MSSVHFLAQVWNRSRARTKARNKCSESIRRIRHALAAVGRSCGNERRLLGPSRRCGVRSRWRLPLLQLLLLLGVSLNQLLRLLLVLLLDCLCLLIVGFLLRQLLVFLVLLLL